MNKRIIKIQSQVNLDVVNSLIIVLLSFFYLTHSPRIAIILIIIPIVIETFIFVFKKKVRINSSVILSFFLFIEVFIWQYVFLSNTGCFSFLFTLVYFAVSMLSFSRLDQKLLQKRCKQLIKFACIILILDTMWRFAHPLYADYYQGVNFFYKYKGPGILFVDTNNTGMLVLAVIGLCWYLEHERNQTLFLIKVVLFVLLILTFSRAAILSFALFSLMFNARISKYIKIAILTVSAIYLVFHFSLVVNDASTSEKIVMLKRVLLFYQSTNLSKLFLGIGLLRSIEEFGLFTHSWPITFSVELGIVGFLLIIALWYSLMKESHGKCKFIIFPCLFAGLSFFPLLAPYFYCIAALITNIEKNK